MATLLTSLGIFTSLFSGNPNAYGQFVPAEVQDGVKQKGKSTTVLGQINDSLYLKHFEGTVGLGICPVTQDGKCKFTVIDIDDYNPELRARILRMCSEYGFPIQPFLSKSGGLHLYTFYEDFVNAKTAVANANLMRGLLGLPKNTEIFPKQLKLNAGQSGNWINLPYFGGDGSPRALLVNGVPVQSLLQAMQVCETACISLDTFKEWASALPLNDAPPCLQTLYIQNDTDQRNNYLYNLACYFKAKFGDDFESHVFEANERLASPLAEHELASTVIASHRKHTYSYKCGDAPICAFCDKDVCKTREYAIGDRLSKLSFEQLIKFNCDEPYYSWIVNGRELEFKNSREIIDQEKFRQNCVDKLNILPNKLKQAEWDAIVNTALANVEERDEMDEISSEKALGLSCIKDWIIDKSLQDNMVRCLSVDLPYYTKGMFYLTMQGIIKALLAANNAMPLQHVIRWLRFSGGESTVRRIGTKSRRVWLLPATAIMSATDLKTWEEYREGTKNGWNFAEWQINGQDDANNIIQEDAEEDL